MPPTPREQDPADPRRRAVTLRDVATEAGVSPATASRALHESERSVRPELRERVLEAAKRLRYSANISAQSVARGASRNIALLVSDLEDPYFASIAAGVIEAASTDGMRVTVDITHRDPDRETESIRFAEAQRARAVIVVGSRRRGRDARSDLAAELTAYEQGGGRVVMVSQPALPFDTVVPDNRSGAIALARALVSMGYERFAVLGWRPEFMASTERVEGFLTGLREAGIAVPDDRVLRGDDGWDGGHRLASRLLDDGGIGPGGAQLLFAVSDVMALGAVAALRERGFSVPEDVAVAGYGGAIGPSRLASTITTVQFALREIGTQAFALATRWKQPGERAVVTIPATVVLRASTPAVGATTRPEDVATS